jgi:hypothetical protein
VTPIAWVMLALLVAISAAALDLLLGVRKLARLSSAARYQGPAASTPRVSIVVAARDEARGIEAAMRSLLAQRYPLIEIVAIDDRSSDGTGEILERLAAFDSRLRVVRVRELPPGWLGKNHALSVGAAAARGEWLLFTDADVVMQPDTVAKAIGLATVRGLDHLAVLPELHLPGLLLQAFVTTFAVTGLAALRPWKAGDPRSRRSAGVGAFNLVRASTYAKAGGHEPIRMRPDDDLKLGKLLKAGGARQEVALGVGMVSVEWYHSLGAAVTGLMKNTFAAVDYRTPLMLGAAVFYLGVGLGPLVVLAVGSEASRFFAALTVTITLALHWRIAALGRLPRGGVLLYPVSAVILAWIVVRALVLNLVQGGIVWRGTFYSLEELRRNRV